MKTTRTLRATNGDEIHELAILCKHDGTYWLHDLTADPNCDSLEQIQDESDTAVMDVTGGNGFEITD